MSAGGYRPNAGRPKGSKDGKPRKGSKKSSVKSKPIEPSEKQKLRKMLEFDKKAKAQFYQEFLVRVSQGETLSLSEKKLMTKLAADLEKDLVEDDEQGKFKISDIKLDDPDAKSFLENLLMAPESEVDRKTKIQICNILLPFQHARKGEGQGKKADLADRAKAAGSGRFAPSKPPKLERVK